jgi:hypothetical protein
MVRPVPFAVIPGGRPEGDSLLGGGNSQASVSADRVMAELTLAFALDIARAHADEPKWPLGRTMAFVVLSSAALWALIAELISII